LLRPDHAAAGGAPELDGFNAQSDVIAKRVTLNDTRSWQRRELFPKEWVTLPGGSYPNSDLVDTCSELILKPKTALKQ